MKTNPIVIGITTIAAPAIKLYKKLANDGVIDGSPLQLKKLYLYFILFGVNEFRSGCSIKLAVKPS
jgi:hypothetical protein